MNDEKEVSVDALIFKIEDYVGGNIEGVESVDRMGFTVFLRGILESHGQSCYEKGMADERAKAEKLEEALKDLLGSIRPKFMINPISQLEVVECKTMPEDGSILRAKQALEEK